MTNSSTTEERFTKIFAKRYWGDEESVSGFGSRLAYTENVRRRLPELIEAFSIKSIFDAPCGDFYWMSHVVRVSDIKYVGGDIVKPLIEKNRQQHQNATTNFSHFDVIKDSFPVSDLWVCRDCLFHLSFADTFKALQRFIESKIPYVLTTTHKNFDGFKNLDVETGDYRLIDLFAEPFCFDRNVLYRFDDYIEPHRPREMCMWSRDQILRACFERRV